jgi:hypothetical protein
MFKYLCLVVAVLFLTVLGWMINDIRLQIRRSAHIVETAGQNVNDQLPAIVQKSRQAADVLSKELPQMVEKTRTTTDTVVKNLPEMVEHVGRTATELAELAEDVRQLKELAGVTNTVRDKNLVSYANSVLKTVESSGGVIGVKKTFGSGLKNTRPAAEWAVGARKEALFLSLLVKSKKEMLTRLARTKFGSPWYIELPGKEPQMLLDWLKENHPESRELGFTDTDRVSSAG